MENLSLNENKNSLSPLQIHPAILKLLVKKTRNDSKQRGSSDVITTRTRVKRSKVHISRNEIFDAKLDYNMNQLESLLSKKRSFI